LIYGAQLLAGKILSHNELDRLLAAIPISDYGFHQSGLISVERQGRASQERELFALRLWKKITFSGTGWDVAVS
jgi:hypothetical protein